MLRTIVALCLSISIIVVGMLLPANAAALPEWDAPQRVSTAGVAQGGTNNRLASGSDGRTVAVWMTTAADGSSAPFDLMYAIRDASGTWSTAQVLDDAVSNFQGAGSLVEHEGRYHAVWIGAGELVLHATLAPGAGTWSAPVEVNDAGMTGRFPVAALDDAGNLQVAYMRNDAGTRRIAWRARSVAGVWGATELVVDEAVNDASPGVRMHVADDGNATVAWYGPSIGKSLRAAQRDAGTETWEAPTTITTVQFDGADYSLAGNADGDVAILTEVNDGGTWRLLVARRPDAGAWDGGSTVPNSLRDGNFAAVVASDGRVTIAWRQTELGQGRVFGNYRAITGGAWLVGLQQITGSAESFPSTLRLRMVIDSDDQITTTWEGDDDTLHAIRGNAFTGWAVDGWRKRIDDANVSRHVLALDRDGQPHVLFQSGAAAASEVQWSRWPIGPATISSISVPAEARVGDTVSSSIVVKSTAALADSAISWRFGDGSAVANGASVTHSWTKPGTYLVSVAVVGSTGIIDSETRTIRIGLAHAAPTVATSPTVTGVAVAGRALSCSQGAWNGTGPIDLAARWQVDRGTGSFADAGLPLGSRYSVEAGDAGSRVRCVVVASNAGGQLEVAADAVAVATPPAATRRARVLGRAQVGRTITCNRGAWRGTAPLRYSFAWQQQVGRRWVAVPRARAMRLRIAAAQSGRRLRCIVTARNLAGTARSTTIPTAKVAPPRRR